MITIGVNGPVYLKEIKVTDKGYMEHHWEKVEDAKSTGPVSMFSKMTSGEITEDSSSKIMMFGPKVPSGKNTKENRDWTYEEKLSMLSNDMDRTKNVMSHIAQSYMTMEEVNKIFLNIFDDTNIVDDKTYRDLLMDQVILDIWWKNLTDAFIKAMNPFVGQPELAKRLLLIRQAADKPFPTYRNTFLKSNPFLEDWEIPEGQSKLKFTKYEISKKLDSDAPVDRPSKSDDDKGEADKPSDAEIVFGS